MLDNSIVITFAGENVTLNRLNQDGYTGTFYGKSPSADVDFHMEVKHQFPSGAKRGVEQHLVKLSRIAYGTVEGIRSITSDQSAHIVLKQSIGAQVSAEILDLQNSLEGVLTDAFVGMVLDRRS